MTALSKYILTSLKPYRSPHRQCTGSLTVSPVASDQLSQQHKPIIDNVMIESPQGMGWGKKYWAILTDGPIQKMVSKSCMVKDSEPIIIMSIFVAKAT